MTYSYITPSTPRPRDVTQTLEIPFDASIEVPKSLTSKMVFGFGEMVAGYVAPVDIASQVSFRSENFRNLHIPRRGYFQEKGGLYVPTQADPKKYVSANPNLPVPETFRGLSLELTTIIKTRTDTYTAESYKILAFARLILTQLQDRGKKDYLLREKNNAQKLLLLIEEVHNSGRIPEGFEEGCRAFYQRIMTIIGESVLDDAVISSLSWERRVSETTDDGKESFPYNQYPFSCRCWVLGVAFSLLK